MSCDVNDTLTSAKCLCFADTDAVLLYLLCQWANEP
jgi:hypothetical protein